VTDTEHDARVALGRSLGRLRAAVRRADAMVDGPICEQIRQLYLACRLQPHLAAELQARASGYGKAELLLPVDPTGWPAAVPSDELEAVVATLTAEPGSALWLQVPASGARLENTWPQAGEDRPAPRLLVARWLCHLIGIRHRTVELFIDHPTDAGQTLVQVRSLGKAEYPGCFDLPVAGHVVGQAGLEESLWRELAEELGLERADLANTRFLGSYESLDRRHAGQVLDLEYRSVYRAALVPGRLEAVRFADGEVAAIAGFTVPELLAILDKQPQRVASGLAASMKLY
jgi:isopentenyldiphosphate isomerase